MAANYDSFKFPSSSPPKPSPSTRAQLPHSSRTNTNSTIKPDQGAVALASTSTTPSGGPSSSSALGASTSGRSPSPSLGTGAGASSSGLRSRRTMSHAAVPSSSRLGIGIGMGYPNTYSRGSAAGTSTAHSQGPGPGPGPGVGPGQMQGQRVWSLDATTRTHPTSAGRSASGQHPSQSQRKRRAIARSFGNPAGLAERMAGEVTGDTTHARLFSDEYDLDPRILQDVQRALQLKARREARIKSGIPASFPAHSHTQSQSSSQPQTHPNTHTHPQPHSYNHTHTHTISLPSPSSPTTTSFRHVPGTGPGHGANSSISSASPPRLAHRTSLLALNESAEEVDFSPSTATATGAASSSSTTDKASLLSAHPVPLSTDGGETLDWSVHTDDSGGGGGSGTGALGTVKKWGFGKEKGKGKGKEREVDRDYLDEMEEVYSDKLRKIHTLANPQTHNKASITANQLARRYERLFESQTPGFEPVNLAHIARWHASNNPTIQRTLERAEPFTWLKHLEKGKSSEWKRLPWHLTALVVEEYFQAQAVVQRVRNPAHASEQGANTPSPSILSSPTTQLEGTRRSSIDNGQISFEPIVPPYLPQLDPYTSRKSSDATSTYSGPQSGAPSFQGFTAAANNYGAARSVNSPASSRQHLRDLLPPALRRVPGNDESDAGSSVRSDHSERSADELLLALNNGGGAKRRRRVSKQTRLDIPDEAGTGTGIRIVLSRENSDAELSSPIKLRPPMDRDRFRSYGPGNSVKPMTGLTPVEASTDSSPGSLMRGGGGGGRKRRSLPPVEKIAVVTEEQIREQEEEEERVRREYKRKLTLLDECDARNYRTRQILNRIAGAMKDYKLAQSRISESLLTPGTSQPYTLLTQEIVEAFSHDPANVVGSTRRSTGWRAVDEIHIRLHKQREILRKFVEDGKRDGVVLPRGRMPDSVLCDPIERLLGLLEILEERKEVIVKDAETVGKLMKEVKEVHAEVKKEYNETLSHTAVVYPELSLIIGLEESYRAQYQHLYDFGMDALTLILDTVTPFWRTYGKTIGEDIRDFLIIPLYRNEFTGEPKRYPLTAFPRRSFRHWVCLHLLFMLCVGITVFQARTAWRSTRNFGLGWVEHVGVRSVFIPLFALVILIQWAAVLVEALIVLSQVGMTVWWVGWFVGVCR